MRHQILYQPSYSLAVLNLEQGESVRAEAGAMVSMSGTIKLQAGLNTGGGGGGFFSALKRSVLGGESLFVSQLVAESGPGEVTLAPAVPGDILALTLSGTPVLGERGSFLASGPGVEMDTKWGGMKSLLGGEGLFYLRFTGAGHLLLSSFGAIHRRVLAPGEKYVVDTGHIVAFEETMPYAIKKASQGWFSTIASGEGLVMEFTGPGSLYLQTRQLKNFVSALPLGK
jgi:uncharacterized protein (TIGR00266 family)